MRHVTIFLNAKEYLSAVKALVLWAGQGCAIARAIRDWTSIVTLISNVQLASNAVKTDVSLNSYGAQQPSLRPKR